VKISAKVAVVAVAISTLVGFRAYVVRYGIPFVEATSPPLEPGAALPHMDHSPKHGGLVLMRGDTHFEVVLSKEGRCQVFFTDATRTELPASFAEEVDMGLATVGGERQNVPLQIDPEGRTWIGQLKMTSDPQAIVRVTYLAPGEQPYWIDVPLSAWPD
jgi:hypothetical protein